MNTENERYYLSTPHNPKWYEVSYEVYISVEWQCASISYSEHSATATSGWIGSDIQGKIEPVAEPVQS